MMIALKLFGRNLLIKAIIAEQAIITTMISKKIVRGWILYKSR